MKHSLLLSKTFTAIAIFYIQGVVFAAEPPASIRVACEGQAVGASVSVNKKFKGECPVDIDVAEGNITIRATKNIDGKEEVFEESLRLGSGARKRVEVRFGSQTNAVAKNPPLTVDPKAIAMQKYEAEMLEYQRSVDQCRPLYADHERQLQQELRAAKAAHRALCVAFWGAEEREAVNNCGAFDAESRDAWERMDKARDRVKNIPSETGWCKGKFTLPVKPQ